MKNSKTLLGVKFEYDGSLDAGLTVYKRVPIHISKEAIDIIKFEISEKSPIKMGACRDNPSKNSIGESLWAQKYSPQYSSYVVPLLIEEGFYVANDKKPFVIIKK